MLCQILDGVQQPEHVQRQPVDPVDDTSRQYQG